MKEKVEYPEESPRIEQKSHSEYLSVGKGRTVRVKGTWDCFHNPFEKKCLRKGPVLFHPELLPAIPKKGRRM